MNPYCVLQGRPENPKCCLYNVYFMIISHANFIQYEGMGGYPNYDREGAEKALKRMT